MPAHNKNSPDNFAQLAKFLASPEGKQLVQLLSKDGSAFQEAAAAAKRGDIARVKQLLSPALQGSDAAQLLSGFEKKEG